MPDAKVTCISHATKRGAGIPEQLLQVALERLMESERREFADNLDIARGMWRKYRALVEAPEFPEPFRTAFVNSADCEPDDPESLYGGENAVAHDFRERTLPMAIEVAQGWAWSGRQRS